MTSSVLPNPSASRRGRIAARDGLIFLALCSISVALFVVTLLLFRSLDRHHDALGRRLVDRGRIAMASGDPAGAVVALRSALTYTDDFPTQVLLAQALADAGRTEEATNYFLNLRETRPGDGFLNLQLARLYRRERNTNSAVDSYRASIFGDWKGDGATRRREVRLELSEYLAQQNQPAAARDELTVAAGNAPDTLAFTLLFGDRFQALGDTQDAYRLYSSALRLDPHNLQALAGAGRAAYKLGNYDTAAKLLTSALDVSHPAGAKNAHASGPELSLSERAQLETLAADARRLPELNLSRDQSPATRADHLMLASRIAQSRLTECMSTMAGPPVQGATSQAAATVNAAAPASPYAAALLALHTKWHTFASQLKARTLARDATLQDDVTRMVNDTETQTATACGAPKGDDALLLARSNTANHL